MRHDSLHRPGKRTIAVLLSAALSFGVANAAASTAAAEEHRGGESAADHAPYTRFAADGRGAILVTLVRRAYLEKSGLGVPYPVDAASASGRPAGPRDEPPPPEWPEEPVGLVVCLRVGGKARACEGALDPPSPDLAASATLLAERLAARDGAAGGRRNRPPRALSDRDISTATLEAAFVVDPRPVTGEEARGRSLPAGVDAATAGFVVEGSRGIHFVMPGEAGSVKKAIRLARKAGAQRRGAGGTVVQRTTVVRAGEARVVNP